MAEVASVELILPAGNPAAIAASALAVSTLASAKAIVIESDEHYQSAVSAIASVGIAQKTLETEFRKMKDPSNAVAKAIDGFFALPREQLDDARRRLTGACATWRGKLEAERLKKEREAQAEREREQKRIDDDRRAAEKLAIDAQRKADEAAKTGDLDAELAAANEQEAAREVVAEVNAAAVQQAATPAPYFAPPRKTEQVEGGASVGFVKRWTFEITDPAAVPRPFCVPKDSLISAAVKAGTRDIPGVRIFEVETSSVR